MPSEEEDEGEDPRAELVRRLQEYERFARRPRIWTPCPDRSATSRWCRPTWLIAAWSTAPEVDMRELLLALKEVMLRAQLHGHHAIRREALSVRQRMGDVLKALENGEFHRFESLFNINEGRLGRSGQFPGHSGTGKGTTSPDRAGRHAGTHLYQGRHRVARLTGISMDTEQSEKLQCIIEAALLASNQPLSLAQLGALFDDPLAPLGRNRRGAGTLPEACEGRGVELVEVASGYRYQVRSEFHPWVNRLWAERQARYSRALLETLALIAYRQPVTRGEIEQVRGVSVSTSIVRTLEEREWIRVVGYRDVPGKPALYGTTKAFLDYFKLKSLDEMPTLAEVRDLDNFDPELAFEHGEQSIPASERSRFG